MIDSHEKDPSSQDNASGRNLNSEPSIDVENVMEDIQYTEFDVERIKQLEEQIRTLSLQYVRDTSQNLDTVAMERFKNATPKNSVTTTAELDVSTRREIFKLKVSDGYKWDGNLRNFDTFIQQLILYFQDVSHEYLDNQQKLSEEYKIAKTQMLLSVEKSALWSVARIINQDSDISKRELKTFLDYIVHFRVRFGMERRMNDLWIFWHELTQKTFAREFIQAVQKQAIFLQSSSANHQISMRILSELKKRTRLELLRCEETVPDSTINLLAWIRRIEEIDQVAFRSSRGTVFKGSFNSISSEAYDYISDASENEEETDTINAVKTKLRDNRKTTTEQDRIKKRTFNCWHCDKPDHRRIDCSERKQDSTKNDERH